MRRWSPGRAAARRQPLLLGKLVIVRRRASGELRLLDTGPQGLGPRSVHRDGEQVVHHLDGLGELAQSLQLFGELEELVCLAQHLADLLLHLLPVRNGGGGGDFAEQAVGGENLALSDEVADLLHVLFADLLFRVEKIIAFQAQRGEGVFRQGIGPVLRLLDVGEAEGVQRQLALVGGVPVGRLPVEGFVQLVDAAADHFADAQDQVGKGRVLLPVVCDAEGRRVDVRVKDRGERFGDRGEMRVAERQADAHLVVGADTHRAVVRPDVAAQMVGQLVVVGRITLHPEDGDMGVEFKELLELSVIISELL